MTNTEKTVDDALLQEVIAVIRQAVAEDWIEDFDIDADTSFNNDLELESIEFVTIADMLQSHFGAQINFVDWLGTQSLDQIIALTVGDLAAFVSQSLKG